jgi:hypothetical protein
MSAFRRHWTSPTNAKNDTSGIGRLQSDSVQSSSYVCHKYVNCHNPFNSNGLQVTLILEKRIIFIGFPAEGNRTAFENWIGGSLWTSRFMPPKYVSAGFTEKQPILAAV